jgi:hypothetical protein
VPKQFGGGDNFYIDGVDMSGDVQALGSIHGGPAALDFTSIKDLAFERQGGERDGGIDFTAYFSPGAGGTHQKLDNLPTADVIASYFRGTAVGNEAACQVSKQVNYDPNRGTDGSLIFSTQLQSNAFGLEWCNQLTPGISSGFLTGDASGFEGAIANWVLALNDTIAQTAAQAHSGTKSLQLTSAAAGTMVAASCAAGSIATQGLPVVPGQSVACQAWFRTAVSVRACRCQIDWYQANGTFISTDNSAATVNDSASAWTLATATLVAPALSAFARLTLAVSSTGAGAEVHYVDDAQMLALPVSYDTGGSLAFGAQAYLHVFAFTGTDATVKIQDSADNITFTDVASLAFTQVTTAPLAQRIAIGNTATVRRYVQAVVVTTGGYQVLSFAVAINKNPIASVVF